MRIRLLRSEGFGLAWILWLNVTFKLIWLSTFPIRILSADHNYLGIPIGTPFRKAAGFVDLFFLTTYRGPLQPDIRPRGETKKPRHLDPMRPLPLCNAWSLRAYSVIDIRIRNWHVCETFRMIWRPGNDRGFSFLIICIFGRCIKGSSNN